MKVKGEPRIGRRSNVCSQNVLNSDRLISKSPKDVGRKTGKESGPKQLTLRSLSSASHPASATSILRSSNFNNLILIFLAVTSMSPSHVTVLQFLDLSSLLIYRLTILYLIDHLPVQLYAVFTSLLVTSIT